MDPVNSLESAYLELLDRFNDVGGEYPVSDVLRGEVMRSIEAEGKLYDPSQAVEGFLREMQPAFQERNRARRSYLLHRDNIEKMLSEIDDSAREQNLLLPIPVYAGVFPTGSYNAQAIRFPYGALLLINTGLMMFIYQSVKLFCLTHQISVRQDHPSGPEAASLDATLSRKEVTFWLADLLAAYLLLGESTFSQRFPAEAGLRGVIISHMTISAEKFVLAHEYGHALAGHLTEPKKIRRAINGGDLDFVMKDWEQEVQADLHGVGLLLTPSQRVIRSQGQAELLSITLSGPFVFFALGDLIDSAVKDLQGIEMDTVILSDHPPTEWRADYVRKVMVNMGAERFLPFGEGFVKWIREIRVDVLAAFREIVETC